MIQVVVVVVVVVGRSCLFDSLPEFFWIFFFFFLKFFGKKYLRFDWLTGKRVSWSLLSRPLSLSATVAPPDGGLRGRVGLGIFVFCEMDTLGPP